MSAEIERKFLVHGTAWRADAIGQHRIRQAYLAPGEQTAGARAQVRVRIVDNAQAVLTIKSGAAALARAEFEYPIPLADAEALLALRTGAIIEKQRYRIPAGGDAIWEVDAFAGDHHGLVVAEIELPDSSAAFARPAWLGDEVTGDPRYYNASLARTGHAPPESASHISGFGHVAANAAEL